MPRIFGHLEIEVAQGIIKGNAKIFGCGGYGRPRYAFAADSQGWSEMRIATERHRNFLSNLAMAPGQSPLSIQPVFLLRTIRKATSFVQISHRF